MSVSVLCIVLGMTELDSFRIKCIDYAKASSNLSDAPQRRTLQQLLVNLSEVSFDRIAALLESSRHRPLLYVYQSGVTSYLCTAEVGLSASYARITRKGYELHEFLMERGFLTSMLPNGRRAGAVIVGHPRPLIAKDAWALYSAAVDFSFAPRTPARIHCHLALRV